MATDLQTKPETKPELTDSTKDKRIRHYVERLSPKGVVPARYSSVALCGDKVTEIVLDHSASVCQACIDESRKRPVEG